MSSSYLATSFYCPLQQELVEQVLGQPIGLPSPALRVVLDHAFTEIRQKNPSSLIYHPDYAWLDNHIVYLSQLTGWQWLALHRQNLGGERRTVVLGLEGLSITAYEIEHLAFAYADAALAERLAVAMASHQQSLFIATPTSEKDAQYLLLSPHDFRQMQYAYPYLQHPLRRSLRNKMQDLANQPTRWPRLEAYCATDAVHTMSQRWQQFVDSQRHLAIAQANEFNPIYLGQQHFTDGQQVFFQHYGINESPVLLEDCDINTFKEVEDGESNGWFATDANHLWNCGEPLPCQNPKQFKVLPEHDSYFTDGTYVYHDNCVLEDVNASRVRAVPDDGWHNSFLHEDVFYPSYGSHYEVDGASFRAVCNNYYVDKDGVYEFSDGELIFLEDFDPVSFEVIALGGGESYLKDNERVAFARKSGLKPKVIKSANAANFTAVTGLPFCSDGKRVWLDGKECKDLDASSISVPNKHAEFTNTDTDIIGGEKQYYFVSNKQVFYIHSNQYELIQDADADADSLELLHTGMLRDKHHIWFYSKIVKDAIASGFAWQNIHEMFWTDGVNRYCGSDLLNKNATFYPAIDRAFALVNHDYYLENKKIEGWSSLSHHVCNMNCIEDTQYYYTCFTYNGGGILVWPKTYSDYPLVHYQLDQESAVWRLTGDIPPVETLASLPKTPIVTREEFDTLFDSINPANGYEEITSTYKAPDYVVTRCRDSRSLNIKGHINYSCTWHSDMPCSEYISPVLTPVAYQQIRQALNVMLKDESPISFATLENLVNRVSVDADVVAFPLRVNVNGVELDANVDVQTGVDSVRGVWIDAKIDQQVVRMMVTEENGFLSGMCYTGALTFYKQADYEGFVAEGWSLERRALFRQLISDFLQVTPAVRSSNTKTPSQRSIEDDSLSPCITAVVALIAPQLTKAHRNQFIKTVLEASFNHEVSEDLMMAGNHYATPQGIAWETLLDELESRDLLVTFNKDDPFAAVGLCNQLATAVGIKELYEPSEDENGESFYTIASDFDQWLAVKGYCLIWPQNSLSASGDDFFPAAIAPIDNFTAINEQLAALGGFRSEARRFLSTLKL